MEHGRVSWRDSIITKDEANGKPMFISPAGSERQLEFNVSHHGERVVLVGMPYTYAARYTGNLSPIQSSKLWKPRVGVDIVRIDYKKDLANISKEGWESWVKTYADVFHPQEIENLLRLETHSPNGKGANPGTAIYINDTSRASISSRSDASSIISTGTKTSIETLTPDDPSPSGLQTPRPGSIVGVVSGNYSMIDRPAPPYESHHLDPKFPSIPNNNSVSSLSPSIAPSSTPRNSSPHSSSSSSFTTHNSSATSLVPSTTSQPSTPNPMDPDSITKSNLRTFYAHWSLREAYSKLTGEALLAPWIRDLHFKNVTTPPPVRAPEYARQPVNMEMGVASDSFRAMPRTGSWGAIVSTQGARNGGEGNDDLEIWLKGDRVMGVRVEVQALGEMYLVATAVQFGGDGGRAEDFDSRLNDTFPFWEEIDIKKDIFPRAETWETFSTNSSRE